VYNEGDEVESEKEVSALTALVSETATLISDIRAELSAGGLKGDKGDKGDRGDRGEQGERGATGVNLTSDSMFALEVDTVTGDLYYVCNDDEATCPFVLEDDGNLYYVMEE
jgi:hypothetical protein